MKFTRPLSGPFHCVLCFFSVVPSLFANDGTTKDLALEEVIVTANKRSENIQDAALSITALNETLLKKLSVDNFEDYARALPALSHSSQGPNRNKLAIRGITDGMTRNVTVQSAVAVYLDDVPLTSTVALPDLHIYDTERIELLSGPQGTLYGASAMGGTLRIINNRPQLNTTAANLDVMYSSISDGSDNHELNGIVNVPLGDLAAVRAVAYSKADGGYIDNNELMRENWNTVKTQGGRLAFRFQPLDNLDIYLLSVYQNANIKGKNWYEPEQTDLSFSGPVAERQDDELQLHNFNVSYDLNTVQLIYVLCSYEGKNTSLFDFSASVFDIIEPLFLGTGIEPVSARFTDQKYEVFSQELRFVSDDSGKWQWTAGLFMSKETLGYDDNVAIDQLPTLFALEPGLGAPDSLFEEGNFYIGDKVAFFEHFNHEVKQTAVFAETSYWFSDQWTATLGMRWFMYDVKDQGYSTGVQNIITETGDPSNKGLLLDDSGSDEDGVTPKLVLEYLADEQQLWFFLVSKGFRVGGSNPPFAVTGGAPKQFESDSLWNYELGYKSSWFDDAAILNATFYYLDWDNMITPSDFDNGFSYQHNAGKASVTGLELESTLRASHFWWIHAGLNLQNAQLEEDFCDNPVETSICTPQSDNFAGAAGDQLIGAANFKLSLALEYTREFLAGTNLQIFIDGQYISKSYAVYESFAKNIPEMGNYTIVNFRFSLNYEQRWQASAFVSNLQNEKGVVGLQFIDAESRDFHREYIVRPRTIGLRLSYQY